MEQGYLHCFGLFKPEGHALIAFPPQADIEGALLALKEQGFRDTEICHLSSEEMERQSLTGALDTSPIPYSEADTEATLSASHMQLASWGHNFLMVRAPKRSQSDLVAEVARRFKASRAQKFGCLIIEEMLHPRESLKAALA